MGPYQLELSFEQISTIEASLCADRRSAEANLARMLEIAGATTRGERAAQVNPPGFGHAEPAHQRLSMKEVERYGPRANDNPPPG